MVMRTVSYFLYFFGVYFSLLIFLAYSKAIAIALRTVSYKHLAAGVALLFYHKLRKTDPVLG